MCTAYEVYIVKNTLWSLGVGGGKSAVKNMKTQEVREKIKTKEKKKEKITS